MDIETFPTSVTQGDSDVSLIARVTNLGTKEGTSVYLNWSLPDYFTITNGNESRNLGTLAIGASGTNTLTISVNSGATVENASITATATGTNLTEVSDTENITILQLPRVAVVSTGGGAGGGSGSSIGGATNKIITYDRTIEIVRGFDESFQIPVHNQYKSQVLKNLRLNITGFLETYISISPAIISTLEYNETAYFTLQLSAPNYSGYQEYEIKGIITGQMVGEEIKIQNYKEIQTIRLIIQEISFETSNLSLLEARSAVKEMQEKGFNFDEAEKLLKEAEMLLNVERKNKESWEMSQNIIKIKNSAIESDDLLRRVIAALETPRKINLLVGNVINNFGDYDKKTPLKNMLTGSTVFASDSIEEIVDLGIISFGRGDYTTSLERAKEARTLLLLERKGNFLLFLYLYWHLIFIGIFLISISGIIGYRKYQKVNLSENIEDTNKEESNVMQIIANNQNKYYSGKMSISDYNESIRGNEKRLAILRKSRISLRNKRIKLIAPSQIRTDLKIESMQIETELKIIQRAYYINKKVSERAYKYQFHILNERLAEIEEERTTLALMQDKKIRQKKFKIKGKTAHKINLKEKKEIVPQEGIWNKIKAKVKEAWEKFRGRKERKRKLEKEKIMKRIKETLDNAKGRAAQHTPNNKSEGQK
ncbi:hypothetical protein HN832_02300 [archaeon]|nr:hypothetical protein [archaeon]MBT4373185.1 hypothetical protein [archaeon]MBT4531530.1 hypothetical protein [archaeon]MBT7001292.1 hypothetical protein [archaeon]MBT7282222.1 hypothetical protein [archaeon]